MFICSTCIYPSRNNVACDNPACLENPTLSASHKAAMRQRAADYAARQAADDERLAAKDRLRKAGFITF